MYTESSGINTCSPVSSTPTFSDNFALLGITPRISEKLGKIGITTPTPIQSGAIPAALEGRDIMGIAQTGTGKTLAFALPIIQKLHTGEGQGLIIVPTRELALQVDEHIRKVTDELNPRIRTAVLIGGARMHKQREQLSRRPRIVIATPGRLEDHLNQRSFNLSKISVVVLDEADRMLDMGFAAQIKYFFELIPAKRQSMLFSATMPDSISRMASRYLNNPVRVEVAVCTDNAKRIEHEICYSHRGNKNETLKLLLLESGGSTIVFSRTKHGAKDLAKKIRSMGFASTEIHSNKSLYQRREALDGFKSGKFNVLVATDIASRGIDVDDVRLVINFDLPATAEDYVHRVGRTGRAGKTGKAISLASVDQSREVKSIERFTKTSFVVSKHSITAGFEVGPSFVGRSRGRSQSRNRRFR